MTTQMTQPTQSRPEVEHNNPPTGFTLIRMIARREIVTQFQRKELWISLTLMVVVFSASLGVQTLFSADARPSRLGVVGTQPEFTAALRAQADARGSVIEAVPYGTADVALTAVREGEVDAALLNGQDVVVLEKIPDSLAAPLREAHRAVALAERLRSRGLGEPEVSAVLNVAPPTVRALEPDAERTAQRTTTAAIGVMVLFFLMFMFGQGIAQGVLEEKSNRIVEILLAKVKAWHLLAGKVLGIGVVALTQITAIVAGGLTVALLVGLVDAPADAIGMGALVIAWFVPGYFLFATLWAVAGSLISRQEDIQHAAGPVSFLQTISLLAALVPFSGVNDTLTRILSLVPGLSSSVMPVRMATEQVPWWEITVAVVLTLVAIVALLRIGARIYSGGLLQHGGIVKARAAMRDAREGGMS
ncbi:ABC-2 type transport system permease protein [Streptosporangium subroseum]|uniref:ABC-2 type transport system permease protein n=1 Tax=Streptosporangium subroseum TaxID=106412 RepID=A0A239L5N4_9ACTN|nr:ABC transporter permease [Streptosporangium subroseum]SNT25123.1 ABC-2 type transport system permease protein [Streptosporangium subroseum]